MPSPYPKVLLTMPPAATADLDRVAADLAGPHDRPNRSSAVRALVSRYLAEKKKTIKNLPRGLA